jgi:hypothetical protein
MGDVPNTEQRGTDKVNSDQPMPTTFLHLSNPQMPLCAQGPLRAAHHLLSLFPSQVHACCHSSGDWSRGGVLAVMVESGYVRRGGSGLLGNKSELARMRRLGRLLFSFNLEGQGEERSPVQDKILSPQNAAVSYRCCMIASFLHNLIESIILHVTSSSSSSLSSSPITWSPSISILISWAFIGDLLVSGVACPCP